MDNILIHCVCFTVTICVVLNGRLKKRGGIEKGATPPKGAFGPFYYIRESRVKLHVEFYTNIPKTVGLDLLCQLSVSTVHTMIGYLGVHTSWEERSDYIRYYLCT